MTLNGIPIPPDIGNTNMLDLMAADVNPMPLFHILRHILQLLQQQESPAQVAQSLDGGEGEDQHPLIEVQPTAEPIPQPSLPIQSHHNSSSSSPLLPPNNNIQV